MRAHVLDDAEHRHLDLLEHAQTFARVEQRDVLRRRDDDRAAHRHPLRQGQLRVAGARRHVDDQVVEIVPARRFQQLHQRLRHHRSAPDHRLLGVDQEADRHDFHAVRDRRDHGSLVGAGRALARQSHHQRLARPVDVGIQQADRRTFVGQAEREVRGSRRLADAALARSHRDDVADALDRPQVALNAVRGDLPVDFDCDSASSRRGGARVARSRPRARPDSGAPETRGPARSRAASAPSCRSRSAPAARSSSPGRDRRRTRRPRAMRLRALYSYDRLGDGPGPRRAGRGL